MKNRGATPGASRWMGRRSRQAGVAGFALAIATWTPARGQETALPEASPPERTAARAATVHAVEPRQPRIDVRARFEAFQRDFAKDFGVGIGDEGDEGGVGERAEKPGEKMARNLARRFEGSAAWRWYERMRGVYDRFEGVYERLETSTRWARSGFDVDPDLEAAVDGKLRLLVERDVGLLDVGVNVDNALDGRIGLRLGGTVRGYKFGFDLSDVVNEGRMSIQIRKTTK